MKLASLKSGGRDGTLIVVSRDLARAVQVPEIAATLQAALDDWAVLSPRLATVAEAIEAPKVSMINGMPVFELDMAQLAAPLPRAFEFVDGSA